MFFFFNDTATTEIYTLSLHDALPISQGTAYITDVGMTGAAQSVIGVKTDLILRRFLTQLPVRFEPAGEDIHLSGIVLDLDPSTGKANSIERVRMKMDETQ